MFPADVILAAETLSEQLRARRLMIVTAESCTGGLISGLLTELPGSSDVLERGFVTYSNAAKETQLGVDSEYLAEHGAVSAPVARAMAEGALVHSEAQVSVAVTGVAGPGGGSEAKPVGLVHIASCYEGTTLHRECRFGAIGRPAIRLATIEAALALITAQLDHRSA